MPIRSKKLSLQKRIVFLVTAVSVSMLSTMMVFDTMSLNQSIRKAYVSQISGMTIAINGDMRNPILFRTYSKFLIISNTKIIVFLR